MKLNPNTLGCLLVTGFFSILMGLPYLKNPTVTAAIAFENQKIETSALSQKLKVIQGPKDFGQFISIEDILKKRKAVLVNFWATWCPPCIDEIPSLDYLAKMAGATTLPPIVTISVDESPNDVLGLFDTLRHKPSFTVLYDAEGQISQAFGTSKFPETFWLDKNGFVVRRWVGPQNWLSIEVLTHLSDLKNF